MVEDERRMEKVEGVELEMERREGKIKEIQRWRERNVEEEEDETKRYRECRERGKRRWKGVKLGRRG